MRKIKNRNFNYIRNWANFGFYYVKIDGKESFNIG